MSNDKVIELGRHDPSVDSIIERLDRDRKHIKHITAIVDYDNDEPSQVVYDTKALKDLSYDAMTLHGLVDRLLYGD